MDSIIPMTSDFLDERKIGRKFVDKTKFIESIMERNFCKKLFFVRPRKFGKSLLVDQMRHIVLGNREAFGPLKNNSQGYLYQIHNKGVFHSLCPQLLVLNLMI
jgi:hypothetical protein